jgi:Stage II sporulation protein E (SpoIIE)
VPGAARRGRVAGPLLGLAVTAFAAAQYALGRPVAPEAWLAIAPRPGWRPARPLAPATFAAPLGLHPDLHPSTFSVRTGDRLLFFTDGLLEARDRAGRFFRVDQQIQALSRPDLQAAVDELLDRLRAHTRRTLDDVAVLLAELTLTDPGPGPKPAVPGPRPSAGATVRAA